MMIERPLQWTAKAFKHPWWAIGITLALTLFLGFGLPQIKSDTSARAMLPLHNMDVEVNDYYTKEEVFGNPDFLFIGIEAPQVLSVQTLEKIKTLEEKILTFSAGMPKANLKTHLGVSDEEAAKILEAISTLAFNESNFAQVVLPKLQDPEFMKPLLAGSDSRARAAAKTFKTMVPALAYDLFKVPLTDTQTVLNGDYITNRDDALVTEKLLEGDITPESVEQLKNRLDSWSLYQGTLISQDKTMTGMVLQLGIKEEQVTGPLIQGIEGLLKEVSGPEFKTYLAGEYVLNEYQGRYMQQDLAFLLPLVTFLLIAAMAFFFRTWQGVVFPLIVIAVSVIGGMGLMAWMGSPLTIVSTPMPVLLMAIACAYGIHQVNHYLLDPDTDKLAIFTRNMKNVGLALLLSGLATMIGFGALVADDFVPIQNFGFYTALGNLIALGGVLYFLPALMIASGKKKKSTLVEKHNGLITRILKGLVGFNRKFTPAILIGALVLGGFAAWGATKVVSELNPLNFFKTDDPLRQASDRVNEKMAGTQGLNLILDSDLRPVDQRPGPVDQPRDILTPEILTRLDTFAQDIQKKYPQQVGKVLGFHDLIKKLNAEFLADPAQYVIPDTQDKIANYLTIFGGDTDSMITSAHDKINVSITLRNSTTRQTEDIRNYILNYFSADWKKAQGLQVQVTGTAHLYTVANDLLVEGTIKAIQICVAVVFLLLLVVLRNLWMTLIALIPIGITLLINFGVLGWFGIPFDAGTAMVSSVAIGIGVDFSIHFITWYRHELQRTTDIPHALDESILHKGRAILYNMFVIIAGFVVLAASRFVPLVEFGLLVSLCMLTTALGSLVLVPAAIRFFAKRGFKFVGLKQKASS